MSEAKGFSIRLYDGHESLTISNTCKSGYITFYSGKPVKLEISLTEEQFVDLVKYLGIEAEKIKQKMIESKGTYGFEVNEGDEENG